MIQDAHRNRSMTSACLRFALLLSALALLFPGSVAAQEQAKPADVLLLEGRRGTQGLSPIGKILAAHPVESPVDFGQLKPGCTLPKLPMLVQANADDEKAAGTPFDLNAALADRDTVLIFWRG
jgi:hypothetical protein